MSDVFGGPLKPIQPKVQSDQQVDPDRKHFILCEHCGKKLIERKPNGLFYFAFGRSNDENDPVMVEMYVHGSMRLRCWRRACRGWNTLNYFPQFSQPFN